jgi:hypothetical protein
MQTFVNTSNWCTLPDHNIQKESSPSPHPLSSSGRAHLRQDAHRQKMVLEFELSDAIDIDKAGGLLHPTQPFL